MRVEFFRIYSFFATVCLAALLVRSPAGAAERSREGRCGQSTPVTPPEKQEREPEREVAGHGDARPAIGSFSAPEEEAAADGAGAADREEARTIADIRLDEVRRHITIDAATEERLRALYVEEELLKRSDLSADEEEQRQSRIPSEAEILGTERDAELRRLRDEENAERRQQQIDREVVFVSDVLKLSPEQEATLREHYLKPDHHVDVSVAMIARAVNLRPDQRSALRSILAEDRISRMRTLLEGSGGSLPDELMSDFPDGTRGPDELKILQSFLREDLRGLLTEEQFNRYLELEAANPHL